MKSYFFFNVDLMILWYKWKNTKFAFCNDFVEEKNKIEKFNFLFWFKKKQQNLKKTNFIFSKKQFS